VFVVGLVLVSVHMREYESNEEFTGEIILVTMTYIFSFTNSWCARGGLKPTELPSAGWIVGFGPHPAWLVGYSGFGSASCAGGGFLISSYLTSGRDREKGNAFVRSVDHIHSLLLVSVLK